MPAIPTPWAARNSLGRLLADLGESKKAWELIIRAQRDARAQVDATLASMSEGERYPLLAKLVWQLELLLSVARRIDDPRVTIDAYDSLLQWKGRAGRLLSASRAQLAARMDDEQRGLVEALRLNQAELSKRALSSDIPDREVHERRLVELREERARLERDLMKLSQADTGRAATFADLRDSLDSNAALVDFFFHDVRAGDGTNQERRLTAWITRRGQEKPIEIDLGPAVMIETAVKDFLEDLVVRRGVVELGEAPAKTPGAALVELLWAPYSAYLEGVETVFVSPDGALGTLPFETLPLDDQTLAIERYAFVYLQDVRALMQQAEKAHELDTLLAIGGVDFRRRDAWVRGGSEDDSAAELATESRLAMRGGNGRASGNSELRGSFSDYWARLPATEYESQVVSDMHEDAFDTDGTRLLLQGRGVSEERLKYELERHNVLHLATHGYFQPKGLPSMWEMARSATGERELRMSEGARMLVGKQPGLLSGLVCAGANRGVDIDSAGDDGYLTAEEIGWLDLSNVELVVLSACETGLGRPQSGEGLLGLRRAFRTAGARTVVSSLWSVKDESTADLMRSFYKNLFLKGMERGEALRKAQLEMLRRNRIEYDAPLPSTWGGFVISGDWR